MMLRSLSRRGGELDLGKAYLDRYGKGTKGQGWYIPLWTVYADWGWGTDDGFLRFEQQLQRRLV